MNIHFITNANFLGGGEMSATYLISLLIGEGHLITYEPVGEVSDAFVTHCENVLPPKSAISLGRWLTGARHESAPDYSDVVVFYLNDQCFQLRTKRWHDLMMRAHAGEFKLILVWNFGFKQIEPPPSINHAAMHICLNSTIADKLRRFTGKPVHILPPPVDVAEIAKHTDGCWENEPARKLSSCLKSSPNLVRHCRRYKHDDNFTLWFVAEVFDTFGEQILMEFMLSPQVLMDKRPDDDDDRLTYYGFSELPVYEFLSRGTCFWYQVPWDIDEQGPRVVVEAMAAGLPVITENRDGMADRVTPETGWLCNGLDDWRSAIKDIRTNPDIQRVKGLAARERALAEFDPHKWIDLVLSVKDDNYDSASPVERCSG